MLMQSGRFNSPVTLQVRSTNIDALGQQENAWVNFQEIWANVKTAFGGENVRDGDKRPYYSHTVATHYHESLAQWYEGAAWRIVYGERLLNVVGISDLDGRNEVLIFQCKEGSVDGQ